jgi:hypothetical protein
VREALLGLAHLLEEVAKGSCKIHGGTEATKTELAERVGRAG